MKPPARLLSDATLVPQLSEDLARIARTPYAYDPALGLARLQANLQMLDPSAAASAQLGAAPTTSLTAAAGAWGGKVVGVVALGIASWVTWTSIPQDTTPVLKPAPIVANAPLQRDERPSTPEALQPQLREFAPQQTPDVAPAETEPSAARQASIRSAVRREIDQLERVKVLMATDPRAAHQLLRRSSREFPRGVLREEREGLTVLVLWETGERSAARARAEEFLARYPESALGTRIAKLIGASDRGHVVAM